MYYSNVTSIAFFYFRPWHFILFEFYFRAWHRVLKHNPKIFCNYARGLFEFWFAFNILIIFGFSKNIFFFGQGYNIFMFYLLSILFQFK